MFQQEAWALGGAVQRAESTRLPVSSESGIFRQGQEK